MYVRYKITFLFVIRQEYAIGDEYDVYLIFIVNGKK